MSVPHVTSRGTKRESQPPPLWETLQQGNLRLRRQPQPPLVNMFFFFFFSPLSSSLFDLFSHLLFTLFQPKFQLLLHQHDLKLRAQNWDGATCGMPFRVRECCCTTDNHRTFRSVLLPCNICKTLLFPTTPPPSRSLHPRVMHTHTQLQTHAHTQPQYPLPLFWPST